MLKLQTYNSKDIFNTIDKANFPYYGLYKDRLDGTDTILVYHPNCDLPAGVMIVRPGDDEDTLHIACLEIAKPIRKQGYGSEALTAIKNNINGIYKHITLRSASPELVNFYNKNGFRVTSTDGDIILMKCDI